MSSFGDMIDPAHTVKAAPKNRVKRLRKRWAVCHRCRDKFLSKQDEHGKWMCECGAWNVGSFVPLLVSEPKGGHHA